MSSRISGPAIRGLQTLYEWGAMGSWTDGQLIARFLGGDDSSEEAFRVLIHRHGPMVLGVCRRVLGDEHAAEDAFQLTFLIFVKRPARSEIGVCSRTGFTELRFESPRKREARMHADSSSNGARPRLRSERREIRTRSSYVL